MCGNVANTYPISTQPLIQKPVAYYKGVCHHIFVWQTYTGLVPSQLLDGLSAEDRSAMWSAILDDPPTHGGTAVFVAESEREIVGCRAAIERFAEGLHPFRHREVADAHFTQIIVHIVAKMVEQRLRERRAALSRERAALVERIAHAERPAGSI